MWSPLSLAVFALLAVGTFAATTTLPIHVIWQDSTYYNYIDALVGTPSQNLNLTLDFFTTDSYLVDVDAKLTCAKSQATLFNYGQSSSFTIIKNYTSAYDNKTLAQDNVQLDQSVGSKTKKFNVTDLYPSEWNCSPYSGGLGLGVEPKRTDTLINQILADYSSKVVTISPDKKTAKVPQLSLTLGDNNNKVCGSKWEEVKCTGNYEFTYPACTFKVGGYSFDTYTTKKTSFEVALSLQQYTFLPSDVYERVLRLSDYDESAGGIPCDSKHADLSIFINDSKFTLSGKNYVGESIGNGYCEFLISNGVSSGLEEDLFVLPIGFFSQNCQQLNFAKGTASLASV